jgi:hypothetical protein
MVKTALERGEQGTSDLKRETGKWRGGSQGEERNNYRSRTKENKITVKIPKMVTKNHIIIHLPNVAYNISLHVHM